MASKKILLGVGLLAAMAIVFCAVIGWPPVAKNDTQGAIGVAKKYQAEQISEQDVVLADPEIQELLQTDFFYQLVTDADFQRLYLSGVLERAVTQIPTSLGALSVADLTELGRGLSDDEVKKHIAAGKLDLAAATAKSKGIHFPEVVIQRYAVAKGPVISVQQLDDLGRALSDDDVKKHIAAGKFDIAAGLASQKGIKITSEDLSKLQIKGMDAHGVSRLTDLGRALSDDDVKKHIAAGKFDVAAQTAQGKQIKVTPADLQKFDMQALGAKGDDIAALGRLLQKDSFQKALPYAGTMQKLMVQSGTFKNAVRSGDMSKLSQDIVGAKKKAR